MKTEPARRVEDAKALAELYREYGLPTGQQPVAVIGADMLIQGSVVVRAGADVMIFGEVRGGVQCDGAVVVEAGAQVFGHIKSRRLSVAGTVLAMKDEAAQGSTGEVHTTGRLLVKAGGRLTADLIGYGSLQTERGARVAGELLPAETDADGEGEARAPQAAVVAPMAIDSAPPQRGESPALAWPALAATAPQAAAPAREPAPPATAPAILSPLRIPPSIALPVRTKDAGAVAGSTPSPGAAPWPRPAKDAGAVAGSTPSPGAAPWPRPAKDAGAVAGSTPSPGAAPWPRPAKDSAERASNSSTSPVREPVSIVQERAALHSDSLPTMDDLSNDIFESGGAPFHQT